MWFYLGMRRFLPVLLIAALAAGSSCKTDGTIAVHSISFNGVRAIDQALLRTALATREDSKIPILNAKLPWTKQRNYFERGRFDADLKRIEAFYADRGYPDARVASFDVKLNQKQDAVDVTLTITEGEPVRVASVDLRGFDVIPPAHLATLQKQLPLRVGEPRDRQTVLVAHDLALNELRDHGYPYSRVATDENDGSNGKSAAITFTAEPGTLAHFGPVEISGNASVHDNVIQRQLLFKPGDLYRRGIVQETQRRLYGMDLFQFVNIESLNPEEQSPEVKTKVTVVEGRHQRMNLGVGYGTEEKARVDAAYHHVNFLGGARSGGAHARWSSLDRGLRLDLNQPYFFAPSLSAGAEAQRWYTYTPAYKSIVTGAKLAFTHQTGPRMSLTVSLLSERNTSEILITDPQLLNDLYNDLIALGLDPRTGKQEGTLSAFGVDWRRTTTDNVLNARRGYQIGLHAEEAGRLLPGTFNYYALSADARHFLPVSKRLVAATRIQIGNIRPAGYDPKQVPFSKKYFLGGASSLRGWGRYEVSPLGETSSLPIGGDTMLAFSTEARLGLRGKLGGVLFLDGGNVWTDRRAVQLRDLRYDAGAGLRYDTPVGPIRLDFGYQLNRVEGLLVAGAPQLRPWRVHFSIGQAF
jgi:outer membrane protein insertion porin family/translocation and assembly module TamA